MRLSDPFGVGTALRPWDDGSSSVANAQRRAKVAFELFEKLGAPFYAFHDRDVAPEGNNLKESHANLDEVVKVLKDEQARTGVKLLWGTANLFTNPRYMHGAATSPNFDVFAYAGAQVKKAMEVTHELGGAGYTFWGGREGYSTLLNTDMKRELDHLARFLHMAVDYKKQIGFTGTFYIEPKPKEPTKHQYDSDAAACLNFLRTYDLLPHFKLNLETNHATLAGHEMMHELEVAIGAGALGSIDANTGDYLLGWDTDQFPTNIYLTTQCMLCILRHGRASPPAASTSTPRSAARASSRSTCSTPTSAAWTRLPAASRSPARSSPTAGSPRSSRSATGAGTASSAAASKPARPASATSKPTSSPRATPPRTPAAARRCSRI